MDIKQDKNVIESNALKYAQSNREANSLKIRLETNDIKLEISKFLTGRTRKYFLDPKTNDIEIKEVDTGVPQVNALGYQAVMSYVESVVNKATVMGNFPEMGDLYSYLRRSRRNFTLHLWINMYKFGIKTDEFKGMLNNIFSLIEPFMTRTVGDGERATIRETTIQQDRVLSGYPSASLNPFKKMFN